MRKLLLWIGLASLGAAAEPVFRQSDFRPEPEGQPTEWSTWAPRREIAPHSFVDEVHYRTTPGSLAISGDGNSASCGGWLFGVMGNITGNRGVAKLMRYRAQSKYTGWDTSYDQYDD